jgi:hypothetical protein
MATSSSRQTSLFGIQDWKKFFQTYATADFTSYDYESLRKNFIDYMIQAYPETYNDFIESSEFVALLDVIAFMGQSMAFRSDLNARENFIDTAERRDSVIKLANLVSYDAKRNIAGQGLVKITAISTTEDLTDINGNNLSNAKILWNDPTNRIWQEQFNTILNATLINSQRIGRPGNSQTILGVKTDEYTVNLPAGVLPVVPFNTEVDTVSMNFEIVSATSLNQSYLYEMSPAPSGQFNFLYRNDKLGYGSANTGFFLYFKQGTLQATDITFPERVKNNVQPIDAQGVNNDDTWLYKLDDNGTITGEWTQVESVYVTTANGQGGTISPIFSVASRSNDSVSYIFSDGVFGEIPYGRFRAYYRTSNALQYTIDPTEMSGISMSMNYISRVGRLETLTMTVSLQTPANTAQTRESIADIKQRAPARYYTQNRMVNGEDYTNFPFTLYSSIIKSKALNRTSIGITRNLDLLDPTGKYSSTSVISTDGGLFYSTTPKTTSFSTINSTYAAEFIKTTLPSLLSSAESIQFYQQTYDRPSAAYSGSADGTFKWNQSSTTSTQTTGYFYVNSTSVPIAVGIYTASSPKYIVPGTQLRFASPIGQYFDINNRLTTTNTGVTTIWASVVSVIGDGYNFGEGNLDTGAGSITLDRFVPTGASVDTIIPTFQNTLPSTVSSEVSNLINLKQDFYLIYYATATVGNNWKASVTPDTTLSPVETQWFVKLSHNATDTRYDVSIKNVTYSFASVAGVRFAFDNNNEIYDSRTGKLIDDNVSIFQTNGGRSVTGAQTILGRDVTLNITGQPVLSDGFVDDYQVTVSSVNENTGIADDPDFFEKLVGNIGSQSSLVYFATTTNSDGQQSKQLLADGTVIYKNTLSGSGGAYSSRYEYSVGTIFYCSLALSGPATKSGTTVTVQSPTPHYLKTGDTITISFAGSTEFSGTFIVTIPIDPATSASSENLFTYQINDSTAVVPTVNGIVSSRFYKSSAVLGIAPTQIVLTDVTSQYEAVVGRGSLSFLYRHNSGDTTRVDPSTTNIIDLYLVTQSYYIDYMNWLSDATGSVIKPAKPTINELRQNYGMLDSYKMISDSVIPNSVTFKPLFGKKADANLQGTIKVIKSYNTTASDSQLRSAVLSAMNSYFSIDNWSFGDTFYFSELTAYLHTQLGALVSSIIVVPLDPASKFGNLYEIRCAPDEIFCNGATTQDITVVSALNSANMNR